MLGALKIENKKKLQVLNLDTYYNDTHMVYYLTVTLNICFLDINNKFKKDSRKLEN